MIFYNDLQKSVKKDFIKAFTKVVKYELHPAQTQWDHNKKRVGYPRSFAIENYYTIMDQGMTIKMRYATNAFPKTQGGMSVMQYSPEFLKFGSSGQIICNPEIENDVDLHYWMSLHPRNEDSPNFDSKKTPIFRRLDDAKSAIKEAKIATARHDAESYILKEWDEIKLREVARAFDVFGVDDMVFEELQMKLLAVMKNNPVAFIEQCMSEEMILRSQISEGVAMKVISHDKERNTWMWGDKTSKVGIDICKVRPGEDPKDRLIKFWRQSVKDENIEYFQERLEASIKEKDAGIAKKTKELSEKNSKRASKTEEVE